MSAPRTLREAVLLDIWPKLDGYSKAEANLIADAIVQILNDPSSRFQLPAPAAVEAAPLWEVVEQSDMTEGRGSMRHRSFHATEQEGWDSINDRGGVSGSHPRNFAGGRQRAENWQQYKAQGGFGDYDVRPIHRLNSYYDVALVALDRKEAQR